MYGTLEVQGLGSTTGGSMSTGKRCRFMSRILPYLRPSPKVAEVLLVRHLRAVDRGPPPGARDAARGGRCGIVGDEHRAAEGSMQYAWRSSSSFASTAWVDASACTRGRRRRD